jgi:N-acetylneuraminic acid mutarotase
MVYDAVGRRIVLFGGVTYDFEEPFGDTWAYDPAANRWTEIATPTAPSPRGWHAMTADAETGLLYLFSGGETRDTELADLWRFDPRTDEWSPVPSTPTD